MIKVKKLQNLLAKSLYSKNKNPDRAESAFSF